MRTEDKDVKGLGRVVRGSVSASGGIVSGSGFYVTKTATGQYTITFLQPFKSPVVTCTPRINGGSELIQWDNALPGSVDIRTVVGASTSPAAYNFGDRAFNFRVEEADPA